MSFFGFHEKPTLHPPKMRPDSVNVDNNPYNLKSTVKKCQEPGCGTYEAYDPKGRSFEAEVRKQAA